jgi:glc operon protein GlcG
LRWLSWRLKGTSLLFHTDDCPISAINIAINKAFTAARDRQESRSLQQIAATRGFHVTDLGDIRYTGLGGGVPVSYGNRIVGAVGVSGMAEEEDVALARVGVEAVDIPGENVCPD